MKESFQKQYDEKSTPWNYDGFDKDIQKFLEENKVFSVWNYSELDKDFDEVFKKLNPRSTVIDLGCGNGAQAYHIQKMGFDVTGTDVVNALEYKLNNFILDDALQSKLTKKYDVIVDRGLIHNLFHLKETRHKYFEMIGNITHDDSYIILKVLSPYEARFNPSTHSGPYRFNEKQLEGFYSGFGFKCVELRDTLFYTNLQPHLRGYLGIYKKEL
jgi:cyclopropane fatty-acyl-phospholipid synthase-like methyltransferase|tara:strand:+ start:178 stop:819 length:642 start_codon:yes stop_codon:yes gene_type:complete